MGIDISFEIIVFLIGAFAAAFVAGLAGFAFGLVAAAIWLHALAPVQAAALIVIYALLVQGYAVWKLRRAIDYRRIAPFIVGSAIGIPAGLAVVNFVSAAQLKIAIGVLLIAFSLYTLLKPAAPKLARINALADGAVGVLNGAVAAATGLGGILPAIWCGWRGWNRDQQRAVFQPTAVATFLMCLAAFGGTGVLGADTLRLGAIGLPALIGGTVLGWALYGKLNEASFRKIVLGVLLASGVVLVLTGR